MSKNRIYDIWSIFRAIFMVSQMDEIKNKKIVCPACETENPKDSESCVECGKDLRETIAYFENKPNHDIEVTADRLIIYKRSFFGKRTGETEVYKLEEMEDIEIGRTLKQLRFNYNGKRKIYNFKGEYLDKMEEIFLPADKGEPKETTETKKKGPKIIEKDLSVTPRVGPAPLTIKAACIIKNTGDIQGEYTAKFKVNSKIVKEQTVTVKAGETKSIAFTRKLERGTYNVTINNLKPVEVRSLAPANITASNLNVTPTSGVSPLTVTVSCNVTNTGELEGDYTAQLKVNDSVVDTQTVTVKAGETKSIAFTRKLEAGTYNVTINELSPITVKVQREKSEKEETKQEKEEDELIELAKKWGVWTFGYKHDIRALPEVLEDGEEIKRMATGYYNHGSGVIVATDRRILFVNKGLLYGIKVESFPYETITSVTHEKGLSMGSIKIYSGGNKAKIESVLNREIDEFVRIIRSNIGKDTGQTPSALDEIKKAKELLDMGAITKEEFEKIKNKYMKKII